MTVADEIAVAAMDAFDDRTKAEQWLREPNIRFGGTRPIDVIHTPEGCDAVRTVLGQIKYGIYP